LDYRLKRLSHGDPTNSGRLAFGPVQGAPWDLPL
jgi:hypothetical protein